MLHGIFRYFRRWLYVWYHANDEHLFRGTSAGFPGGDAMQQIGITSTTTDPLVAVLFALESSRHGLPGVVHIALRSRLANRVGQANNYQELEREVAIEQLPADFASAAEFTVSVDSARAILIEMGFHAVPPMIADKAHLQLALVTTSRLGADEIRSFVKGAIWKAI